MGAARSGVDRLSERSRAVAWRPQGGGARSRGVRHGRSRRRQGGEGLLGAGPRRGGGGGAVGRGVGAGGRGEKVWRVAAHEGAAASARELAPFAKVIVEPFGDI